MNIKKSYNFLWLFIIYLFFFICIIFILYLIVDYKCLLCEGEINLTKHDIELLNFYNEEKYLSSWNFWEIYNNKYNYFREFKIKNKFESLILTKNVISWILSRRNPNKAKEYKRPKNFTPIFTDIAKTFRK